jgi:hemerythrin-like metal-binding protein
MNFVWDNSYSVNNEIIDSQHQRLLGLFDDTYKLLATPDTTYKTIELISELLVYSIFHFSEEERLMKEANFEGLDAHILEHASFIKQVNIFKTESILHSKNLDEEVFLFLADWIVNHIKETDSMYIDAIRNIK